MQVHLHKLLLHCCQEVYVELHNAEKVNSQIEHDFFNHSSWVFPLKDVKQNATKMKQIIVFKKLK